MRHESLCTPPKKGQQVINKPSMDRITCDHGREYVEVPHLFHAAHDFLRFHSVQSGLDGCICRPSRRWKALLNFADGGIAFGPEHIHDLKLEPWQSRDRHVDLLCV